MTATCLVVGAGQAGLTFAQTARERGWTGRLRIVGEEAHPPYQRPPLSKKFLAGEIPEDRLLLKPPAFYAAQDIELSLGLRIDRIDLAAGRAVHAGGDVAFDHVVLATGTRPRSLPLPGMTLPGVHTLRGIPDVERVRPLLAPGARLAIIGAGYIGLEVAAIARAMGLGVTVVEAQDRVMARVVAPPLSRFYEELHRRNGVALMLGTRLSGIEHGTAGALAVVVEGAPPVPADLVLVAVGAQPNTELAREAGLRVDDGILVDGAARASAPNVFAVGDCARLPSALYGRSVRLESVQNAIDQAKVAAGTLTGAAAVYDPVPWFWSDQFEVKLQIAGLSQGHDAAVVRGDPASGAFSVLYLKDGRLLAVDSVNRPRDHMLARRLVGRTSSTAPERLQDPDVPMETVFSDT